jgi:LysM repeat protein
MVLFVINTTIKNRMIGREKMKKITFSVLATGSLALFAGATDSEASSYTVKSGDTLWKVALNNNVSVTNLKQWNNLSSDLIYPNQTLTVEGSLPAKTTTVPVVTATTTTPNKVSTPQTNTSTSSATSTYTVKSGDTLSRIAQQNKTTVASIQSLNGISGHLIYPGQKLKVNGTSIVSPPSQVTAPKPVTKPSVSAPSTNTVVTSPNGSYRVVSGDTLSGISYRHGVSVTQLKNWNGLSSNLIRVGQVLKVENRLVATQPDTTPVSKPTTTAPSQGSNSSTVTKLISTAMPLQGIPYVWGGASTRGFDCSGFIHYVYNKAGVSIPRTNAKGLDARSYEVSKPQVGDLVFFKNTYTTGISHVGVYIGNNQFIHAGGDRVQVTSLSNSYWSKHFDSYKRFYAMN